MDLTYDELDAILRDQNAPGDVRAAVQTEVSIRNYLNSVDFNTDDSGYVTISAKAAQDVGAVAEAPPSGAQTPAPPPSPPGATADTPPPPPPPPGATTTDETGTSVPPDVQARVMSVLGDPNASADEKSLATALAEVYGIDVTTTDTAPPGTTGA